MELGECLRDRQGNWYRVDSWTFEDIGFGEARLTVEMTPVKERKEMTQYANNGSLTVGPLESTSSDGKKHVYFPGMMVFEDNAEINGDIASAFGANLALFHKAVMKTEDVEGVYVNGRNTTVKWADGSHTTVHCGEEDPFDLMLGFLLCVAKRHFGGTGRYLEVMRKNGIPETPRPTTLEIDMTKVSEVLVCAG